MESGQEGTSVRLFQDSKEALIEFLSSLPGSGQALHAALELAIMGNTVPNFVAVFEEAMDDARVVNHLQKNNQAVIPIRHLYDRLTTLYADAMIEATKRIFPIARPITKKIFTTLIAQATQLSDAQAWMVTVDLLTKKTPSAMRLGFERWINVAYELAERGNFFSASALYQGLNNNNISVYLREEFFSPGIKEKYLYLKSKVDLQDPKDNMKVLQEQVGQKFPVVARFIQQTDQAGVLKINAEAANAEIYASLASVIVNNNPVQGDGAPLVVSITSGNSPAANTYLAAKAAYHKLESFVEALNNINGSAGRLLTDVTANNSQGVEEYNSIIDKINNKLAELNTFVQTLPAEYHSDFELINIGVITDNEALVNALKTTTQKLAADISTIGKIKNQLRGSENAAFVTLAEPSANIRSKKIEVGKAKKTAPIFDEQSQKQPSAFNDATHWRVSHLNEMAFRATEAPKRHRAKFDAIKNKQSPEFQFVDPIGFKYSDPAVSGIATLWLPMKKTKPNDDTSLQPSLYVRQLNQHDPFNTGLDNLEHTLEKIVGLEKQLSLLNTLEKMIATEQSLEKTLSFVKNNKRFLEKFPPGMRDEVKEKLAKYKSQISRNNKEYKLLSELIAQEKKGTNNQLSSAIANAKQLSNHLTEARRDCVINATVETPNHKSSLVVANLTAELNELRGELLLKSRAAMGADKDKQSRLGNLITIVETTARNIATLPLDTFGALESLNQIRVVLKSNGFDKDLFKEIAKGYERCYQEVKLDFSQQVKRLDIEIREYRSELLTSAHRRKNDTTDILSVALGIYEKMKKCYEKRLQLVDGEDHRRTKDALQECNVKIKALQLIDKKAYRVEAGKNSLFSSATIEDYAEGAKKSSKTLK